MKELMGSARNISFYLRDDGEAVASIEVAIALSEPVYFVDGSGALVRRREEHTFRFLTTVEGLRMLAENCEEWAVQAEDLVKQIRVEEPADE